MRLKGCLKHRVGGEVIGGYIIIDKEQIRAAVEAVAVRILERIEQKEMRSAL